MRYVTISPSRFCWFGENPGCDSVVPVVSLLHSQTADNGANEL